MTSLTLDRIMTLYRQMKIDRPTPKNTHIVVHVADHYDLVKALNDLEMLIYTNITDNTLLGMIIVLVKYDCTINGITFDIRGHVLFVNKDDLESVVDARDLK